MSTKMATLVLLKMEIFWDNGYDVIISVYGVINKNLSRESNYIVDVVMWLKFGNSSISVKKVIITLCLLKFDQKNQFQLKLKVRKFWRLISRFAEITKEKLVEEPPSWIGLRDIQTYSEPWVNVGNSQPCHILSPGIFETGGTLKTLWNFD